MGKFLLVVAVAAVVIYLTVRLVERRRGGKPTPKPAPRPMGPDDDPDFLWDLDRKKRHRPPPPPPAPPASDDSDEPGEPDDEAKPA